MSQSAKDFFSGEQRDDIKQAIMNAELDTSGEIRVHIDSKCKGEVMDRAYEVFKKLKMHDTGLRNGVLFYLAVKNRKFAIIGDKGINEIVPEDFWEELKSDMLDAFREGNFTDGLIDGITRTGTHLKQHFPYQTDDVNELPDEISFED
ncbi:MAG: TPM domain-containing protein [Bacteroidetes bacterium]|nr:MAG: TPM domain-containing protein [Bacteroidota bacterium]